MLERESKHVAIMMKTKAGGFRIIAFANCAQKFCKILTQRPRLGKNRRAFRPLGDLRTVIRIGCLALICCLPSAAEARPLVYVTNSLSNTVSVIDVGRGQRVTEIPVGNNGHYLERWKDGRPPSAKADHPVVYVTWHAALKQATHRQSRGQAVDA
jgi:YVTN family beta-propeller protein